MCPLLSVLSTSCLSAQNVDSSSDHEAKTNKHTNKNKHREGGPEKLEEACVVESCSWAAAPVLDSLSLAHDMKKKKKKAFKPL